MIVLQIKTQMVSQRSVERPGEEDVEAGQREIFMENARLTHCLLQRRGGLPEQRPELGTDEQVGSYSTVSIARQTSASAEV